MNEINSTLGMFLSSPMFQDLLVYDTGDPTVWIEIEETVNPGVQQLVLKWIKSQTQK